MRHKSFLGLCASVFLVISCTNKNSIAKQDFIGNWIEVMPVNKHIRQGIVLHEDGTAASIGMATLQYESWDFLPSDNQIVFSGRSIGNKQTIAFSDTLSVCSLSADTLTLGKGDMYRIQYVRDNSEVQPIGGSDAAMGYTYSDVLKKKIRIFETGERVLSATDKEETMAGYLVFATDSSQIELFLPDDKVVLDRRQRPDGTSVWNQEDDDTYLVEQSEGKWLVSRRGLLLYATEGMEDALQATFLTDDNQEIQAVFYQRAGVVQLMFDTEKILLKQYRTASGYGYSNPLYDLRGKGREALLTRLSDGKKYALKEK